MTATTLFACVDPQKAFDDFGDRVIDAAPVEIVDSGGGDFDGGVPDVSGPFLLSLRTTDPVAVPLLRFLITNEFTPGKEGGTGNITIQALIVEACEAGMGGQPVGDEVTIEDVAIDAKGGFTVEASGNMVPGEANPLLCGTPITANIVLTGNVQSADSLCGTVSGNVESPISGDLAGTFGAIRLAEPVMTGDANLPEAVTACQ